MTGPQRAFVSICLGLLLSATSYYALADTEQPVLPTAAQPAESATEQEPAAGSIYQPGVQVPSALRPTSTPAPTADEPAVSAGDYAWVLVSLILVLLAFVFLAWSFRRYTGIGGSGQQGIRLVSVLSVGHRERVMLLKVADKHILVGVTAHAISLLHVFDELADLPQSGEPVNTEFSNKLQALLAKGMKS